MNELYPNGVPKLHNINKGLPKMGNIGVQIHRSQEVTDNVKEKLIDLITRVIKANYRVRQKLQLKGFSKYPPEAEGGNT